MDSKDFGLEITRALGGIDHLHYGYWDPKAKPTIAGLFEAQEKHTDILLKLLDKRAAHIKKKGKVKSAIRILDIGCGSGKILSRLLEKGYQVDGMVPSDCLYEATCENVARVKKSKNKTHAKNAKACKVYKCYLEDFYDKNLKHKYDILFFSESFQYIKYRLLNEHFDKILNPHGEIILSDFFAIKKKVAPGSFGGGHILDKFYTDINNSRLKIISDRDVTKNMAPNLDLLNFVLLERLLPSFKLIDEFLKTRIKFIYSILKFILGKSLKKIKLKYFSGHRTAKEFRQHKSYRMMVLQVKQ